jgi:diaminopimelate decarboxylase
MSNPRAPERLLPLRDLRSGCLGIAPLTGRLEPWQVALCRTPALLAGWLEQYGSPLNVLDPRPLARHAAELRSAAAGAGVELAIYLARKANKALSFVDEARRLGLGVDVASERELRQALDRGVPARDLVVTAAIKPRALLELCVAVGVPVMIDNEDELGLLAEIARRPGGGTPIAFRLSPVLPDRPPSRFGMGSEQILALVDRDWPAGDERPLTIAGVHFHLDGYDAGDRVLALRESLALVDALRERGHPATFIDMGGGIPISYLDDVEEWERFWREHRAALLGEQLPLTFEGHGLGLVAHAGEIVGRPNVYPYHQELTGGRWLAEVLAGGVGGRTVAQAIASRGLELRCEPGRALLDGCGITVARVEFRKQRLDGTWLIGVAMNRTQCRSTSDDFLVDPLLLRAGAAGSGRTRPIEGYLVGAYCIERELLTWRRLRFPHGVQVGDLVVFPNTAGYLMHILESASHQIPLAANVVVGSGGGATLDPIDGLTAS